MQYDQQTAEWTSQLVEYQMEAADMLEDGKLRDQLLRAYGRFRAKSLEGRLISPIDVMNRIEKIVVEIGDVKTPNNHYLVKTGRGFPPITGLVNRQFKLVVTLNPVVRELLLCTLMRGISFGTPTVSLTKQQSWKDILQQPQ